MSAGPCRRPAGPSNPLEDCMGKAPPHIHLYQPVKTSSTSSASNSPFFHPFTTSVSLSEDQATGNYESNLGGESSGTPGQWKKPADSKPVSCVTPKIPKNVRNGSTLEQKQQQQREQAREAASRGPTRQTDALLSGGGQTRPGGSHAEAQAEAPPRCTAEELRSKLAAFRFQAKSARVPICRQNHDVHQQDSTSRRTPAGVGGSASRQVGNSRQGVSCEGRKRKHPSHD